MVHTELLNKKFQAIEDFHYEVEVRYGPYRTSKPKFQPTKDFESKFKVQYGPYRTSKQQIQAIEDM